MNLASGRLLGLAALLTAACAAHAGPTGLALMPIADILKHREAEFSVGLLGYERNVSKGYDYSDSLTFGVFDRVELGYDNDFRGAVSANAKLQLFESDKGALSVGVSDWRGDTCNPYVVGRLDGKGYRLHAGFWRCGGAARPMVGTDFPAGPGFTGSLEYLGGPGSQTWVSMFYAIPQIPGLGLQIAGGFSADRSVGAQHAASLTYAFKF